MFAHSSPHSSWLDPSELEPDAVDDDERWHVMMGPGEVSVLTLEQLDDLFRLELIDAQTPVWQPHMDGWLTLGEVAGIEPDAAPEQELSPPPAPAHAAYAPSSYPPPATYPEASYAPPAHASSYAPSSYAPSSYPPPATYPEPSYATPAPTRTNDVIAFPSTAPLPAVETMRPIAGDVPFEPASSGRGGFLLVAAAVLAGAVVTLYRNDVLRDAAAQAGQQALYQKMESAVGAPGFGTLRSLESFTTPDAKSNPAVLTAPAARSVERAEPASTDDTAATDDARPASTRAAETEDDGDGAKERASEKKDSTAETKTEPAAKTNTARAKTVTTARVAAAPARPHAKPVKRAPPRKASTPSVSSKSSKRRDATSAFDPLNPSL